MLTAGIIVGLFVYAGVLGFGVLACVDLFKQIRRIDRARPLDDDKD